LVVKFFFLSFSFIPICMINIKPTCLCRKNFTKVDKATFEVLCKGKKTLIDHVPNFIKSLSLMKWSANLFPLQGFSFRLVEWYQQIIIMLEQIQRKNQKCEYFWGRNCQIARYFFQHICMTFEIVLWLHHFYWREIFFSQISYVAEESKPKEKEKFSGLSFYDSYVSCLAAFLFLSHSSCLSAYSKLMEWGRVNLFSVSSCLLMWILKAAKCNKDEDLSEQFAPFFYWEGENIQLIP